jgi:hypothetical protein
MFLLDGKPMKTRIAGKEPGFSGAAFNLSLRVSNTVSRQPPTKLSAAEWRHRL